MALIDTDFEGADGKRHHITVESPAGSSGTYHVMIDKYFVGQVVPALSPEYWIPFLNSPLLYSDDIGAIADTVKEYEQTKT